MAHLLLTAPRPVTARGQCLSDVDLGCHGWGVKRNFEDVEAWIVNYKADQPYPAKFVYRACTKCNKSLENGDKCGHGTSLQKAHFIYRFKILMCDHSGPLWGTIFDAARTFLGVPPAEFFAMDPEDQWRIAAEKFERYAKCSFQLQGYRGEVTVKCLQILTFRDCGPYRVKNEGLTRNKSSKAKSTSVELDESEYEALMSAVKKINFWRRL